MRVSRGDDFAAAGDYFGLPAVESFAAYGGSLQSRLQCPGFTAMCRFTQ